MWYARIITRVVAKKIVSWLRFSLSQSPFFLRETWDKIFVPNLLQHPECRATKLCVYKMVEAVHRKRTR